MRMLDRYVSSQFLKTFFFGLLTFGLLFVIIDMIENLDDFIDRSVPMHIIIKYYIYFLPRIFSLMMPVAMLLASMFTTGKLSTTNELTIMKSSGISLYRFMLPFIVIGILTSISMVGFDGWAVPKINSLKLNLEREYLGKNIHYGGKYNLYFQESGNRIIALDYYDESSDAARRVSMQQFDALDPTIMMNRYDAASMTWQKKKGEWILRHGVERIFEKDTSLPITKRERAMQFDSVNIGKLTLTPINILRMQQKPEEMELSDLKDYIKRQQTSGSDISRLTVDYYAKIAFPFSNFIVVLFGVPFASTKRRSGLSVQFGISVLICFVYLVCQKLSQVFGYNGDMEPMLSAWLPNILFFLSGCFVIFRVQK